jgi:hypothetical protein
MKKIVVTFGLIAGAIMSAMMMLIVVPNVERIGLSKAEVIGYTSMVAGFLMVFFGTRAYRESVGGTITFGKAFTVGILITVIACMCYVVAWEILYFNFEHDFMDKYAKMVIEQAKASGASPAAIEEQVQQMKKFKELYENPFFNAALTFVEPFPVGLVMTLISSAILRRKKPVLAPLPENT